MWWFKNSHVISPNKIKNESKAVNLKPYYENAQSLKMKVLVE